jgi:predicted nuclease with TOPRIM domain
MADANVENKATTSTAPKARKAAPKRKTAAKKAPAKKAAAKKTTSRAKTSAQKPAAKRDLRAVAVETGRNALRAGLGVYGKAYDQMQEQFEALQKQVDEAQNRLDSRRKQAEELYESLVKRGAMVEQDALKAFEDLELDALTDRSKLEEQMTKAKARFEALRAKLKKAA